MGALLFQPSQFRFLPGVLLRMLYVESESELEKELPVWVGLCAGTRAAGLPEPSAEGPKASGFSLVCGAHGV